MRPGGASRALRPPSLAACLVWSIFFGPFWPNHISIYIYIHVKMTFPGGLAATPDPPHGGPGRAAGGPGKAPGTQGDPGGRRGVRGAAGPPGTVWLMLAADSCKTWRFLVCSRAGFSFVPVPQAPGPGPRASGPGPGPRAPGLGPGPRPTARSPGPGPGPGARGPGPKARYRLQIASQDFFGFSG